MRPWRLWDSSDSATDTCIRARHCSSSFLPAHWRLGMILRIRPVHLVLDHGRALALSATDACRDRLAAFYHWSDRQSLDVAVQIALRRRVRMAAILAWSRREGADLKFAEFKRAVGRARRGDRPPLR